ncbi:MAG: HlyD family efflux transporter periplasmic adaptor subunit, partial [Acidobacteriota bacterium]
YKTMLFTGISTIFFNVNPLVKIDGYHALTSLLEMPDLREESFHYLGLFFQKHVLRLDVQVPVTTKRRRRIYWIYGPLALAYVGVIMSFIAGVLNNLYHKILPDFAVVLLVASLAFIFKKRVRLVFKTARLLYLDKKEFLMSGAARPRLAALAAALLLLLFVPFSRQTLTSEGVLAPAARLRVEAPEDGQVEAVLAKESDAVHAGDVLVRMSSAAATAAAAESAGDRERSAGAARASRSEGDAGSAYRDERKSESAGVALTGAHARLEKLAVRSPLAGRVLTPRTEDLEHRFVQKGSLLLEVGDCRELVVALPVSERLHDDLRVGAEVTAYVRQRPLEAIHGAVRHIAPAAAGQPGTAAPGVEPSLPGEMPDRFVALAFFPNPGETLRPGSFVRAKIAGPRRSWAARGFRILGRWMRTVFW